MVTARVLVHVLPPGVFLCSLFKALHCLFCMKCTIVVVSNKEMGLNFVIIQQTYNNTIHMCHRCVHIRFYAVLRPMQANTFREGKSIYAIN